MSPFDRWTAIADRLPISRRLHLVTPMRLSVAAVAAAAALALVLLFWPEADAPPFASAPAEPTPTVEASPGGSTEPTPSPMPTPSITPSPVATATPAPTPLARWESLAWSDPITPQSTIHLIDVMPWNGGYVAVGSVVRDSTMDGAFLWSPDGLHWSTMSDVPAGLDRLPTHLVPMDDEVLAFSGLSEEGMAPLVWSSVEGATWSPVAVDWDDAWETLDLGPMPASWSVVQHGPVTGLVDVARGPDGLVVIGNAYGPVGMVPVLLHSVDGRSWSTTSLPGGSAGAMLNSIVARDGGFVVVGAVGVGPDTGTAEPAGWTSDDGLAWTRATVDAGAKFDPTLGGEFGPIHAGRDGLVTCRGNREMGAGGPRFWMPFVSTDGRTWSLDPDLAESPACGWAADDGSRIVALGPSLAPIPWPGLSVAWVSTGGATWTPLALSPTLPDMLERFWVVPDGVIYAGQESFWFGTPTTAP